MRINSLSLPLRHHGGNPTCGGRITLLPTDCPVGSVVVINTHRWIAIGLAAAAAAAATTTFTAGLHNYTDDLQAQITSPEAYRKLEFHQFSRQDLLNIALAHQPDSAPGAAWNYSNTNYIRLGMFI
jgi:hypothetical protein